MDEKACLFSSCLRVDMVSVNVSALMISQCFYNTVKACLKYCGVPVMQETDLAEKSNSISLNFHRISIQANHLETVV